MLPLLDAVGAPASLAAAARQARRELLARELLHKDLLQRLHAHLCQAGVSALLIKGEALACSLYTLPAVRPRHDIDLWIAPQQRLRVDALLRELGGQPQPSAWGHWIQPEQLWRFPYGAVALGLDLHWHFCSRPALVSALPLDRLLQRASPWRSMAVEADTDHADQQGAGLHVPAAADALLLACIHRRAHHRDGERWIWLSDIALLWQQLGPAAAAVVDQAIESQVACLLADVLRKVSPLLPEPVAAELLGKLDAVTGQEPARQLLRAPGDYSDLRFDLRYAAGKRLSVLRDYLLPRADYMRWRYAQVRPSWLPWLYLRRLLRRLP